MKKKITIIAKKKDDIEGHYQIIAILPYLLFMVHINTDLT